MKHIILLVSMVVAALFSCGLFAAPPQRPSIEQLAAFPQYSSFTISPDGAHIAALRADGEERVIDRKSVV